MSSFTTSLDARCLDDGRWQLLAEFDFASDTLERIIRVPPGFVTDFASVPWPFDFFLRPTGRYGKAAVVHDMLYHVPEQYHETTNLKYRHGWWNRVADFLERP